VQDEYIYPNSVAFVAPSKPVVLKETLRKDISKLEKELHKAKDTIEKLRSRLNEKSSKKSKVDGGDGKTIEVLAVEKAKEMLNTWRTDDEGRYKEQIRNLQESHARQTERIDKLEKDLAEEKTKCAGLEKDASHKTQLHKLEVDNLDKRLKAAERREEQLQTAFFPRLSSMALSRRGEMTSVNQFTPESLHDENGNKRRFPPGAGESP
jgi:predicted RNase H-like nuclease (RuvC/YqgF family)